MSLEVLKRGLLATVQDLGRKGYGKYGISSSGAMDSYACSIANWLAGNEGGEALLEITWSGFSIRFLQNTLASITGADLTPESGGISVPMWRPVIFRKGSELTFKRPVSGCRSYVAVLGGIDVPEVMGSRSTYMRAGIGGLKGRALQSGDVLKMNQTAFESLCMRSSVWSVEYPFQTVNWSAAPRYTYGHPHQVVRVTRGREYGDFSSLALERLLQDEYIVKPESDRMGYRLKGPQLPLVTPREYVSEGVAAGTVQVPADGQPIILMADRQTLGGYPKIAQVASVDLPRVAQLPPGGSIRFHEISQSESEGLYFEQTRKMKLLKSMIDYRLREGFHAAAGFEL
ncbi:biotin-dependent carboxyltransferase family protein [Paenibacillus dokdonensis]|uniref:Biotin-dependent carboxyltransferase family protein n=1 Tax=Paenibacillus dokdonensis TaxID=2567944 RepID=A0ABU6GSU1_9BACL|nr:biotin-dependent carboxyltransferase family protein [Paenibacillus dokdonensis]MEC0242429.1 biotin-dependent carboxyltransferase family protein [Paenibacillus dokdonensis]